MNGIFSSVVGFIAGLLLFDEQWMMAVLLVIVAIQLQQLQALQDIESLLEN